MRIPVLAVALALLVAPTATVAQSPSSSAAPRPSPAAGPFISDVPGLAPPPSPSGPAWRQTLQTGSGGPLVGVVAWRNGAVAIGRDGKDRPIAWVSADGLAWERAPRALPGSEGGWLAPQLVAFRDRLFAIGNDGRRLAVWSSPDGHAWTRAPDQAAFAPGRMGFSARLQVRGAAASADRLLVVGYYDFDTEHAARNWWSDDGATWHQVRVDDPALLFVTSPVAIADDFAAVACCSEAGAAGREQLVHSTDGIDWSVVGALPNQSTGPLAIRVSDGMLYVAGYPGDDRETPAGSVWSSPDGIDWALVATGPEGISGEATLAVDDRLILLAGDGYEDEVGGWDWTLGSTNGGPWELSAGWPGMAPGCIDSLALLPDRAIAVGGCEGPAAWAMERPD